MLMARARPTPLPMAATSSEGSPGRFAASPGGAGQGRHHLVGDELHQPVDVGRLGGVAVGARLGLGGRLGPGGRLAVAALEDVVAAQVAVVAGLEADVVVAQALLQVEQLLRLTLAEVV